MHVKQEECWEGDESDSELSSPKGVVVKVPMKSVKYRCEDCGEEYEFSSVVYHGLLNSGEKLCYCEVEREEVATYGETADVAPAVVPTGPRGYNQDHSPATDQTSAGREDNSFNSCTMTQTLLESNIKKEESDFDMNDILQVKKEDTVCNISDMNHTNIHSFKCEECGQTFEEKNSLQSHMNLHSNKQRCKEEEIEFEEVRESFNQNINLINKPGPLHTNSFRKIQCGESGKSCKNKAGLQKFKCEVCGEAFKHRNSLYYDHMPIHTNVKPFQCKECGKTFSRKYTLQCHEAVHTGARNYSCGECGKAFSQSSSRNLHVRVVHKGKKKYKCEECGKTFCNKTSFQSHLLEHSSRPEFPCDICGKIFAYKTNLTLHMKVHNKEQHFQCGKSSIQKRNLKPYLNRHEKKVTREFPCVKFDRKFHCENCGKNFAYKGTYLGHKDKCPKLQVHAAAEKFSCDVCHKTFTQKNNLVVHTKIHSGKKTHQYQCEKCGMSFRRQGSLNCHKKTCQKFISMGAAKENDQDSREKRNKYWCKICGEKFKTSTSLFYDHMPLHSQIRSFKCEKCGKMFSRRAALQSHMSVHSESLTEKMNYVCNYCSATFTERQALISHENDCNVHGCPAKKARQNDERRFMCIYCGQHFKHNNSLRDHIPTHTNIWPFKCDLCGKTFLRKYNLKVHQSVHSGEKNFHCKPCDKAFTQKSSLNLHLDKYHSGKEFKCKECGKILHSKFRLQSHIRMVHTGVTNYPCKVCGKSFIRKVSLALHYRKCLKGEEELQCEECGETFTKIKDLENHMEIH